MCAAIKKQEHETEGQRAVPLELAVGMALAHDITEIRPGEFKGCAFRKGHIIGTEDLPHLRRLGKENVLILELACGDVHEDEAAMALAGALSGEGVETAGAPREGRANLIAGRDGLLKIDKEALLEFNMLGEVVCATLHDNTLVRKGQIVAGTRSMPLVLKRKVLEEALALLKGRELIRIKELKRPKTGVVITGNEVYCGLVRDAFAPVIRDKIEALGGEITDFFYAPDDAAHIEKRLRELLAAGAELLILTGGMSVDPDDVTRSAVQKIAEDDVYGAAVLPGSMFLSAYINREDGPVPVLGVPACALYHKATVLDLLLPRILAGEKIGREELARLGHGGLCLACGECRYPVCPFGK